VAEFELPAHEIAYVGDRVDNDVLPTVAAGMIAVHVRRGPWGYLQDGSAARVVVTSLLDLPDVLTNGMPRTGNRLQKIARAGSPDLTNRCASPFARPRDLLSTGGKQSASL
jgi:hypothetical protein